MGGMFVPTLNILTNIDVNNFFFQGLQIRLEKELIPDSVLIQIIQLVKNRMPIRFSQQLVSSIYC